MEKYTWLYFDLDNTILDFDKSSGFAFYDAFDKHLVSLEAKDYKRYKEINHEVWLELEKGNISPEVLKIKRWEIFLKEMNLKLDPEIINNSYFDHIKYNPLYVEGAKALLAELQGRFNLCLITNGLTEVQIPRLRLTGLDKVFDPVVISQEIGVAKPAAAFFDHIQKLNDSPLKESVLVIGDTLTSDIRGGINYGFDTCWYNYGGIENKTEYHPTYTITEIGNLKNILAGDM